MSWNVNSLRARHSNLTSWIARHQPELVLLQETKCAEADFAPLAQDYRAQGYEVAHHGTGAHAGVAILSRVPLDEVEVGFPGVDVHPFTEPRLISARCADVRIYCVYAPSGRRYRHEQWFFKLNWFRLLRATVDVDEASMVVGDFNVQPAPIDVYDPNAWRNRNHGSQPERDAIAGFISDGLRDVTREHLTESGVYTWWGHRRGQFEQNRGMRIDLALCTPDVADLVHDVWVDLHERARPRTSDHAPLVIDLE